MPEIASAKTRNTTGMRTRRDIALPSVEIRCEVRFAADVFVDQFLPSGHRHVRDVHAPALRSEEEQAAITAEHWPVLDEPRPPEVGSGRHRAARAEEDVAAQHQA